MRMFLLLLLMLAPALAEVRMDVEYARRGDLSLKLDAHVPEGKGPFPAVILVHGGGWEEGEKAGIFVAPLLPVLDRSGLAWFTIDYRLAPKYTYPAPVEDVQDAIRWVKKHAKEYRVDPNRIVLMGESAGGHLVALIAARPNQGYSRGGRGPLLYADGSKWRHRRHSRGAEADAPTVRRERF